MNTYNFNKLYILVGKVVNTVTDYDPEDKRYSFNGTLFYRAMNKLVIEMKVCKKITEGSQNIFLSKLNDSFNCVINYYNNMNQYVITNYDRVHNWDLSYYGNNDEVQKYIDLIYQELNSICIALYNYESFELLKQGMDYIWNTFGSKGD